MGNWHRTPKHDWAEQQVREAFRKLSDARTILTIWQLEQFVRDNVSELGSRGFVTSVAEAITKGATVDLPTKEEGRSNQGENP